MSKQNMDAMQFAIYHRLLLLPHMPHLPFGSRRIVYT